jgi:hypothetical protein
MNEALKLYIVLVVMGVSTAVVVDDLYETKQSKTFKRFVSVGIMGAGVAAGITTTMLLAREIFVAK